MKERLWRRSDPSLAPSKEEERDQSRGPWHSKRCQDTHTQSTFHIMHLTSFRSTFEGDFTVHFILLWAQLSESDHMGNHFFYTFSVVTAPKSHISTCCRMTTQNRLAKTCCILFPFSLSLEILGFTLKSSVMSSLLHWWKDRTGWHTFSIVFAVWLQIHL